MVSSFGGFDIRVVDPYFVQVPAVVPKRKNRRIRKKALKRYGYKTETKAHIPDGKFLINGNVTYCNRATFAGLQARMLDTMQTFRRNIDLELFGCKK